MSKPIPAPPVKLIFSILAGEAGILNETIAVLSDKYGSPDYVSAIAPFNYTDYYRQEMGEGILRRFLAMERLIEVEKLPDIKLATNKIEDKFSSGNKRQVNVDPGYLSAAHLILATGKGYAHRPYLRDGIYADLTLIFQEGKYSALPWTYPDYAGEKLKMMFAGIRAKYLLQLKKSGSLS